MRPKFIKMIKLRIVLIENKVYFSFHKNIAAELFLLFRDLRADYYACFV